LRHSLALLLILFVLGVTGASGCDNQQTCPPGQTYWTCHLPPLSGCIAQNADNCAANNANAVANAKTMAVNAGAVVPSNININCTTNDQTTYYTPQPLAPYKPQGGGGACDVSSADDACMACVKEFCCGDYQACPMDTNCSCLVGCLYEGGTLSSCATENGCGPPSDVSIATSACLSGGCPACASMGDMASGMCAQPTGVGVGVGAGGGSTPACTPGSAGAGEACLSDADCASCVCNNDFCN
jgi:hypothetical protein